MEFLKSKWLYALLALALLLALASAAYLYLLSGSGDPYAGGMLVRAVDAVPARAFPLSDGSRLLGAGYAACHAV